MTTKVEIITLPYQHPTQTIDTHILMAIQQTQEVIACQSYLVGPPTAQALVLVLTLRGKVLNSVNSSLKDSSLMQGGIHTEPFVHSSKSGAPFSQTQIDQKLSHQESASLKPSKRRQKELKLQAALAALSQTERAGFEALRSWRHEESIRLGVPVFEVANNKQLIECVTRKPNTLTALRAIAGFGEKRVERFGVSILKQLQALKLIHPLVNPHNVKKEQATETQATETQATETQATETQAKETQAKEVK